MADRPPLKKRSEVSPRIPDGRINNCAVVNDDHESRCQICKGSCPDRAKFAMQPYKASLLNEIPGTYAPPVSQDAKAGQAPDRGLRLERAVAALMEASREEHPPIGAGDSVSVTIGKVSMPGGYDVGPVAVTTRVRADESMAQTYARGRRAAALMFDCEIARCAEEHAVRVGPEGVAAMVADLGRPGR